MSIDNASWHHDARNFPKDLPSAAGATHIGMFFAWIVLNELESDELKGDLGPELEMLRARTISPGEFVWKYLDGKLSEHDLNAAALGFATACYQPSYLPEFERVGKIDGRSEYYAPDDWSTYRALEPFLDHCYRDWLDKS